MENKNSMLLTVIAVATLLVAVVGATFAYFTVTGTNTTTTTNVTTTAENVGLVSLTQGAENFYLNLKAHHMANTEAAKTVYYGTTDNSDATTNGPTSTEIAKVEVTGGSENATYYCNFNYSITTNGAEGNKAEALNLLKEAGKLVVTSGAGVNGIADTYVLGTDITNGTGTVTLTGPSSASISAYVQFENLDKNQSDMAGASFTTSVKITGFSCDTAQVGA